MKKIPKIPGFTLVELVISLAVLTLIILFSFSIYGNFFDAMRNLRANNLVYEETRFLMNRMVQEVRNNTVDYEEYYNQSKLKNQFPNNYTYLRNEIYGQNYCEYSRQFYSVGDDGEIGTLDDQSTGQRNTIDPADGITEIPPAIGILDTLNNDVASPIQDDLFLINVSGNERVYIKRIEGTDNLGNTIGQVGLLKLEGKDFGVDHVNAFDPDMDGGGPTCDTDLGEGDGRIDTWICAEGFPCQEEDVVTPTLCNGKLHKIVNDPSLPEDSSFVAISPSTLNVTDLKFIVSPMDDPRKAYKNNDLQIQPHVTIKMTAQAAPGLSTRLRTNRVPTLALDSTVSTRIYSEIVSECNLKQCHPGVTEDKSCPLTAGVCGPAIPGSGPTASQTCTADYLWSGCTAAIYQTFADTNYPFADAGFPGSSETYFEDGLEYQSCEDDLELCVTACGGDGVCENACQTTAQSCRDARCTDGYDNDCSGAADDQDSACVLSLCSDGLYDPAVEAVNGCIDVGGACQAVNPLQTNESVCNDGLDNDCDGFADQFDADCVQQICTNGVNNAGTSTTPYTDSPVSLFLNLGFTPKNYLLSAQPADGGATFLNECSGFDEASPDISGICSTCYDEATGKTLCECGTPGCTETKIVPGHDYIDSERNQECYDGLDNDCDGEADELDTDCQSTICSDEQRNCNLVPSNYTPANILTGYTDASCVGDGATDNDERCIDIGGLCQGFTDGLGFSHSQTAAEDTASLCQDGLDNNCDGGIDWADGDGNCCTFGPYCLQNGSTTFSDTLESSDYVGEGQAGVIHDTGAGEIRLSDPASNNLSIVSELLPLDLSACSSFDLSLNGTLVTNVNNTPEFMLSPDNGVTWCGDDDCSGDRIDAMELANSVTGLSGGSILWRAFLSGDGTSPIINQIQVTSNCVP